MITRDALYEFIEDLIDAAGAGTALENAVSARNLRTSTDTEKIIRVECFAGFHVMTATDKEKEKNVRTTIQSIVTPATVEQEDLDDAVDLSFDMGREIFEAIANDPSLGNLVCDSYFDEFETGPLNIGATVKGATYLDGLINQAS